MFDCLTGVQLVCFFFFFFFAPGFSKLSGTHGSPSSGGLLNLLIHQCGYHDLIYLFVLDDS